MVGVLLDYEISFSKCFQNFGRKRCVVSQHDRDTYPDYEIENGKLYCRIELKGLPVYNPNLEFKNANTNREEASRFAIVKEKIQPNNDIVVVVAWMIERISTSPEFCNPKVIDFFIVPAIELAEVRDKRLEELDGFIDNNGIPWRKARNNKKYQFEKNGKYYNRDDNFGKLRRIPHPKLIEFLNRMKYLSNTKND